MWPPNPGPDVCGSQLRGRWHLRDCESRGSPVEGGPQAAKTPVDLVAMGAGTESPACSPRWPLPLPCPLTSLRHSSRWRWGLWRL